MILSMNHSRPGYIADANMVEWPKSVEVVQKEFNDAKIVIPGHGDWGNIDLLSHTLDILNKWNAENIKR